MGYFVLKCTFLSTETNGQHLLHHLCRKRHSNLCQPVIETKLDSHLTGNPFSQDIIWREENYFTGQLTQCFMRNVKECLAQRKFRILQQVVCQRVISKPHPETQGSQPFLPVHPANGALMLLWKFKRMKHMSGSWPAVFVPRLNGQIRPCQLPYFEISCSMSLPVGRTMMINYRGSPTKRT